MSWRMKINKNYRHFLDCEIQFEIHDKFEELELTRSLEELLI